MAVPKKKTSKGRTTRRHKAYVRKQQTKLINNVALSTCGNCGEMHRNHHVCESCGHYNGEQVVDMLGKEFDKITTIKA